MFFNAGFKLKNEAYRQEADSGTDAGCCNDEDDTLSRLLPQTKMGHGVAKRVNERVTQNRGRMDKRMDIL